MKLIDVILLSLAAGFFMIGVHQCFVTGITESYWIFMIVALLMLWFRLRRARGKAELPLPADTTVPSKGKKKKRG